MPLRLNVCDILSEKYFKMYSKMFKKTISSQSRSRISRDLFPSAMLGWYQRCRPFPARRNVFQFVLTGAEKGGRHSRLRSTASRVILVKREAYERRPPRLIPWFYSLRPIRRTRRGCKHHSKRQRQKEVEERRDLSSKCEVTEVGEIFHPAFSAAIISCDSDIATSLCILSRLIYPLGRRDEKMFNLCKIFLI